MIANGNILIGLSLVRLSLPSSGQVKKPFFIDSNYVYSRKGADIDYPYVITFLYKSDTNWSLKKLYFDSAYSTLVSKTFFYKRISNGPMIGYVDGKIAGQCFFIDGKYDGESLTFTDGKITRKAYFNKGVKTGTWIEYNKNGKVIRKTDYDSNGNMTRDISYKR